MSKTRKAAPKKIESLTHKEDSRLNIPTAEYETMLEENPLRVTIAHRDAEPQLLWRGKSEATETDAPPLYIQEKLQPRALLDELRRYSEQNDSAGRPLNSPNLFDDFNGLPSEAARTEFYQHEAHWTNRMILGDSLQVMASLAEREGLRSQVQCIYFDPPYGIKFNSNFQWSTTSRDVKDGKAEHITREPEQVKAFRDTWRDGIHSYLSYLRDRLAMARELLAESGSIFVQIGDENVHRVRAVMDEVFGEENFVREIFFTKTGSLTSSFIGRTGDRIIWYARNIDICKFRPMFEEKWHDNFYKNIEIEPFHYRLINENEKALPPSKIAGRIFQHVSLESSGQASTDTPFGFQGETYSPNKNQHWKVAYPHGMNRLALSGRIVVQGNKLRYRLYIDDYPIRRIADVWEDTSGFTADQTYVVETRPKVIQRCILMATDPGDLVLDPTCGSGTTAYVAEQWGRRWITIDTSRVALALARARIMGARYPYYVLADSRAGQQKEAELSQALPSEHPVGDNIRFGFVYERVPHITLKSIANNTDIDVIWEKFQPKLEALRQQLNAKRNQNWQEWELPRTADEEWPAEAKKWHAEWWKLRIERQRQMDASIAARADFENLYDCPYEDKKTVRVAGPFTVESLLPHRAIAFGPDDEPLPNTQGTRDSANFVQMVIENLRVAGVQQAHKEDRIVFVSLDSWAGKMICAEGVYEESAENEIRTKRAAIFIGPEFGTVSRPDLVRAAREAAESGFDVLVACAFNYDAHTADVKQLGRIPVLQARMNADLHMAGELKDSKGNLFVIFGEPDIEILEDGPQIRVRILGVDVFHPTTGQVRCDNTDGIACWFIDTDYNEESFFVRHAYFLGANDPYKSLKTTLKAEICREAWETLHSDTSRAFERPQSGRIAVKVINHLGDEVMKVYAV